jgi:hypothetical protein
MDLLTRLPRNAGRATLETLRRKMLGGATWVKNAPIGRDRADAVLQLVS